MNFWGSNVYAFWCHKDGGMHDRSCDSVATSAQGEPKKATFQDREGGGLPARGERVQDEAEAAFVARVVEELRQV